MTITRQQHDEARQVGSLVLDLGDQVIGVKPGQASLLLEHKVVETLPTGDLVATNPDGALYLLDHSPECGECDFCGTPDGIAWEFPCEDFQEAAGLGGSRGSWAACDACAELVTSNDRTALSRRCIDAFMRRYGLSRQERRQAEAEIGRKLRIAHDAFFSHRTGEGIKLAERRFWQIVGSNTASVVDELADGSRLA